VLAMRRNNN